MDHQPALDQVYAASGIGRHPVEPPASEPRFPAEDGGQSLLQMAQSDFDAALQLLADRAQYITGASGAAIALRHADSTDMLCRASAGLNAPELGAVLSMEDGLSGTSVRTRQALLCGDAENDPRVNREGCRQLGIASVVIMPIMSEGHVLGVFELFSGKTHAFDQRDLAALQRLSEMVETAVRHAIAAQAAVESIAAPAVTAQPELDEAESTFAEAQPAILQTVFAQPAPPEKSGTQEPQLAADLAEAAVAKKVEAVAPKKPTFWTATAQAKEPITHNADSVAIPPMLRKLQKCQACGFPVSQGRTFCVECEEKKWRGQPLVQPPVISEPPAEFSLIDRSKPSAAIAADADLEQHSVQSSNTEASAVEIETVSEQPVNSADEVRFLNAAMPPESWFAAHKYIVGALLLVIVLIGVLIGAIAWLR